MKIEIKEIEYFCSGLIIYSFIVIFGFGLFWKLCNLDVVSVALGVGTIGGMVFTKYFLLKQGRDCE